MECYGQAPGFYGKFPSYGDFVGRRLPPDVRDCFDLWLQAALVRSKEDLGAGWLPAWGSSPLWRFVVGAGVCGEQAWAGVMMPSADRVGRCFPLLLAAGMSASPSLRACLTLHDAWFGRLEDLALSALDEGFVPEDFDAALLGIELPFAAPAGAPARPVPFAALVVPLAGAALPALAGEPIDGRSAWWTDGSPRVAACLAVHAGLPAPAAFAALLDGGWEERGWRQWPE
jgi:type VI secretion system protein ImpM